MYITTAVIQTLLYTAATTLQLVVGISHKDEETVWFPSIAGIVLISQMCVTIWSLVWIYQKMDFQGSLVAEGTCVFSHLIQMGPVWRCLKVVITKDPKDVTELGVIYLVVSIFRDAPFVVLQTFLMVQQREITAVGLASVVVTFLAVCVPHTCAVVAGKNFNKKDSDEVARGDSIVGQNQKDTICSILHFVYRVAVLISRFLAFSLFVDVAGWWVFLILALHLSIHWSMTVILSRTRKDTTLEEAYVRYHLINLLEVFDLINRRGERDGLEVISFYCIVALQNATMVVLWFLKVGLSTSNTAMFGTVLCSFVVGATLCVMRMRFTTKVSRIIYREARSISSSPVSPRSTDGLVPSCDYIHHPTKDTFVVSLEDAVHGGYDNGAYDKTPVKNYRPTIVKTERSSLDIDDLKLLAALEKYSEWKGRVWEDSISHVSRVQSGHQTNVLHLHDTGLSSKCSLDGVCVHVRQTTRRDDDSALDNSCESSFEKRALETANSSPSSRSCEHCRGTLTEKARYRRSVSDHSLSCSTCSPVHQQESHGTSCSRTYCSRCEYTTTCSSGSSSGSSDWDNYGDADTWNETWPPRRKIVLEAADVSALPEQPTNSHEHVRKWLKEIHAVNYSTIRDLNTATQLPRYPENILDQITGKEPIPLRTDSYHNAQMCEEDKNLHKIFKFKKLFAKICTAQNSTVYEQLRGRRNTVSGAELKMLAKRRHTVGQESVI